MKSVKLMLDQALSDAKEQLLICKNDIPDLEYLYSYYFSELKRIENGLEQFKKPVLSSYGGMKYSSEK